MLRQADQIDYFFLLACPKKNNTVPQISPVLFYSKHKGAKQREFQLTNSRCFFFLGPSQWYVGSQPLLESSLCSSSLQKESDFMPSRRKTFGPTGARHGAKCRWSPQMGEVGGRGWKFFDTRPCAKDEYFRAHQEKDIGSHLYIDPRRFYEVFLVSDF